MTEPMELWWLARDQIIKPWFCIIDKDMFDTFKGT